eukprot:TRINITY_DN9030_c0_g1_i1.p1 TRINITY_DN9030_c0_g1~~TRINITY_DN9030_c0_g1_i1.p1  ORF type:complete len:315 (+),score=108.40 TRINITY_DN9030_c0_g1_i1:57-1001(+)
MQHFFVVFIVLSTFCFLNVYSLNERPIIGILTQESPPDLTQFGNSYIPASYVKYVESGGARVVPVHYNSSTEELTDVFGKINGILYPGGDANTDPGTPLYKAGKLFYDLAIQSFDKGDHFVVFGHCQGMELLTKITTQDPNILGSVIAENITIPLNFTQYAPTSRLFGNAPSEVYNIFEKQPVTLNNHEWGLYPSTYENNKDLNQFYSPISWNNDINGVSFISTFESKKYPVYGTQWHPEKPQFEWNPTENINHSIDAILAMQYMQAFLANEGRKNNHHYPTQAEEDSALIYNFTPVYTEQINSNFEQCYFWNE